MRAFPSWHLGWWSLYAWLMMVGRLEAASFTLTPQQRDAAMEMGRQSVTSDRFGTEWKVGGDGTAEGLVVMTPFYRLALAARNATFKSEELKPKDVDALLKEQEGKLTVWATLKGPKADFARFYIPVLMSGPQQIKPTFTQNERTARREDDGAYTARCLYVFPAEALKSNEPVTLIVKNPEGKDIAKFSVNLSAMR